MREVLDHTKLERGTKVSIVYTDRFGEQNTLFATAGIDLGKWMNKIRRIDRFFTIYKR